MADTLQKLLDSMNPQQPAIVQSATATQEIPIFGNDLEICNMMPRFVENAGVAKTKKDNNPAKNAKGKNTRPLNSFMAFRCYYAVLFDDFEQKIISTYIVFLWERDPCKAKWALAAKAYSIIRDQVGKEHAPLDVFLALVAELLGLVDPQHYLAVMGWEIAVNEVGNVSLMQNNTIEIGDNVLCTNISVEDIVTYACQHGYAGATRSFATMPSDKPVMAMAASAQFFSEKSMGNKDQENRQRALQDFTTEGLDETATIPHSMDSRIFNGSSNTTYAANNYPITTSPVSPGFDNFVNLNAASTNLIQQIISPNPQGSLMTNPTPLTTATSTVNHTNHYTIENLLDFDPDTERSVYDPADGDKWDVFDISAWVHADAYTN